MGEGELGGLWTVRGEKHYITFPEQLNLVLRLIRLWEDEREDCESCGRTDGPSHGRFHVVDQEGQFKIVTRQCESGSRWYNPETMQLEGRAHCTCNSCF